MAEDKVNNRLECLKLAVAICHRDSNNDPDTMIALSKKLCDYVETDKVKDKKSTPNAFE